MLIPIADLEFLRRHAAETDSNVNREIRRAIRVYRQTIEHRQRAGTPPAGPGRPSLTV